MKLQTEKESHLSEVHIKNEEKERMFFLQNLIKTCKLVDKKNGLYICLYPEVMFDDNEVVEAKSLIVLGQTGSGKTTLLSCLLYAWSRAI